MTTNIKHIQTAIRTLKQGKMVILTDHPERENEGDLVIAAEKISTKTMNFIIQHTSGIVCLATTKQRLKKLHLPFMVPVADNTSLRHTPFTISIDARHGITTGVSAADRMLTVKKAMSNHAKPDDLVRPGHIFPLQAKEGGVLERQGHTEGAVDLVKIAGLQPAAVLCELINAAGTMMRGKQLNAFAAKYKIPILSIDDIVTYRLTHENLIAEESNALLPLENYGTFKISVIREKITNHEHIILTKKSAAKTNKPILVRIHSSCLTGDLFASQRCDCHKGLHHALKRIDAEGGILIYLNQEGRGIGLFNKINAYTLQQNGLDTVEANESLGFPADARQYYLAANILRNLKIKHVRLLTNNPQKIADLKKFGIDVTREAVPVFRNQHNYRYLRTKKEKMQHDINLD
jgi:3,4-dihydroxy 2-butanone 4-phosphate synthase/GTP cyclohydrolase II